MTEESTLTEREAHRKFAVDLFNQTWTLLDKAERTLEENDAMLHAAHASRHHWGVVGEPVHLARGEWQVSRVYAVLNRSEPALYHARRSLDICRAHAIGDFDLAYAYEALAHASAVAGMQADRDRYLALAREAGAKIAEQDDREIFENDIATIPT